MKKLAILIIGLALTSCATTSRVNDLSPGMTVSEVKEKMGNPDGTEFKSGAYVLKYSLHKAFVGFIPYYLVFNPNTKKLHSWYSDMNEYNRNQAAWGQAFNSIGGQLDTIQQRDHEKQIEYMRNQPKYLNSVPNAERSISCEQLKQKYGNAVVNDMSECKGH